MRALIFVLFLIVPFFARAEMTDAEKAQVKQDFQQHMTALAGTLEKSSYTNLALLARRYLTRVHKVEVTVVEKIDHAQKTGPFTFDRELAEWSPNKVKVAGPRWIKTPREALPLVGFHEGLGATGYTDDKFDCSSLIYILTSEEAQHTLSTEELHGIEAQAETQCKFAGGTTGITGGGDDFNARTKLRFIKDRMNEIRGARSSDERAKAVDHLQGVTSFSMERQRHGREALNFDMAKNCLSHDVNPDVLTVKDMNTDPPTPIPRDAANGWTYDKASHCVIFHGRSIPRNGIGPGVFEPHSR